MSSNAIREKKVFKITLEDLSCVRGEDQVELDLTKEDEKNGSRIDKMIDELRTKSMGNKIDKLIEDLHGESTMAGAKFGALKSTYRDDKNPILVLTIKGRVKIKNSRNKLGVNVTTSFLIRKEDLYLVGFCPRQDKDGNDKDWRDPMNWTICNDGSFVLRGATNATFGVNYVSSHPSRRIIGKAVLLENLHILNKADEKEAHGEAFHSICYHIAEATRFIPISMSVRRSFKHEQYVKVTEKEAVLTDYWGKLSDCHRMNHVYHKDCDMPFLEECGIRHVDMITRVLRLLVRESDNDRMERRRKDQLEHGVNIGDVKTYRKRQDKKKKAKEIDIDIEWNKLWEDHLDKLRRKQVQLEQRGSQEECVVQGRINEVRCKCMWSEIRRLMNMDDPHHFNMLFRHLDLLDVNGNLTWLKDDFNNDYRPSKVVRTYE